MENTYFCSFSDTTMYQSLQRIGKQAKKFKLFKKVFLFTERELPQETREECAKIIEITGRRRGYGYWIWKPVILLECLNKMKTNDILVYTDACSHLNYKGKTKLLSYIEQAKQNDIWVTKMGNELNELNYTKADTRELFKDMLPTEDVLKEGQIQSGNIIMTKNEYTINIIKTWKEYMNVNNLHYFDDSESISSNITGFKENRHDQSIFSLILKCNHYTYSEDCKTWTPDEQGWKELEKTEPILNKRDKVMGQYYSFKDKLALIKQKIKEFIFK